MTKVLENPLIVKNSRTLVEKAVYPDLRTDDLINEKYRVLSFLSEGTFGKVYKCSNIETNKKVVIKLCRSEEKYKKIFDGEIQCLRLVGKTPSLVHFMEDFTFNEHLCIVMEFLHRNLQSILDTNTVSLIDTKTILTQVLAGLDYLSTLNLIHCDIKPANIMIKTSGKLLIKIIDFGSVSKNGQVCSTFTTLVYEAPEMTLGLKCSLSTDMWSVGIVTLQMLTRKVLFDVDTELGLLKLIVEEIGPVPSEMLNESPYKIAYASIADEKPNQAGNLGSTSTEKTTRLTLIQLLKRRNNPLVESFVRSCLKWKQNERLSIKDAMKHDFFQNNSDDTPGTSQQIPGQVSSSDEDTLFKLLQYCATCGTCCQCVPSETTLPSIKK